MPVRDYTTKVPPVPPLAGGILSHLGIIRNALNKLIRVPDFNTYTPTLTNVVNLTGSTAQLTGYMRVGNMVYMFGAVDANATAASATLTRLRMSLPIVSALTATTQAGGSGNTNNGVTMVPVVVYPDIASDTLEFYWFAAFTGNQSIFFHAGYQIL